MNLIWLTGVIFATYGGRIAAKELYECSAEQSATDGRFKCLNNCDEDHVTDDGEKYCLSYFPDDGNCYLKPYTKEDVLSCNGEGGGDNPPIWLVLIGGSNQYMMLKVMLDVLLDLPGDAGYDPTTYYNAQPYEATGRTLYSELAIMDFVWDADRQLIRKTAYWWDADCYYCLPSETEEVFLDVPPVTRGSFRISYANIHFASQFRDRFKKIVSPGCDWLSANPKIHVYMEWSGRWGDTDAPSSTHETNLRYLNSRSVNEGLNIASFVMTDSAEDCDSGALSNVENIRRAYDRVVTAYPKYYFSKRDMQFNHFQLTDFCVLYGSHTMEPLNMVFGNRYYNIICNPANASQEIREEIPVCVDLGDEVNTNDRCFGTGNGQWMENLKQVCIVDYLSVGNNRTADNGAVPSIAPIGAWITLVGSLLLTLALTLF